MRIVITFEGYLFGDTDKSPSPPGSGGF